jgi:hypothetical protein
MKTLLTGILLLSTLNTYAEDCRGIYQNQINEPTSIQSSERNKFAATGAGILGGSIGYSVLGVATAASPMAFYLAGVGLVWGGNKVVDMINDQSRYNMITLINEAYYYYQSSGAMGDLLSAYVKRLEKNGFKNVNVDSLAANIIRSNEDLSLCKLYKNYKQFKKSSDLNPEVHCIVRLPKNTSAYFVSRMQKRYDHLGIYFTATEFTPADIYVAVERKLSRKEINSERDVIEERDYFRLSDNSGHIKSYLARERKFNVKKGKDAHSQNTLSSNKKVLQEVVADAVEVCQ